MRLKNVPGLVCCLFLGVVNALAESAPAQTPPPQTTPAGKVQPAPTSYPPALYRMNDVSKALKLNPEQINRLNAVTDKIQGQYTPQYGNLNTLNGADRFARMQALNRQYYNDWNKGTADILNAEQRARYQQLNYQYGGFASFYDPDVQKRLNLTPTQVQNLRQQVDWNNQQMNNINRIGGTDPTKAAQLYNTYWQQRQQRLNTFLTPAQRQTWQEMTGEPYTFQPAFTQPR